MPRKDNLRRLEGSGQGVMPFLQSPVERRRRLEGYPGPRKESGLAIFIHDDAEQTPRLEDVTKVGGRQGIDQWILHPHLAVKVGVLGGIW
jgi:hypothetical protein